MASHHPQASPPGGLHPHHGPPGAHPQANGHMPMQAHHKITPQHMAQLNEAVWLQIGKSPQLAAFDVCEINMCDRELDRAHGGS